MAELFRRDEPEQALEWTGERLVSGLSGEIESEHLHRYFMAREFCRGKEVLDVASGEGYGTALLAQTAQRVTGVELDPEAVAHASRSYRRDNIRYLQGNATKLPLEPASVDVVVSFETLEHFFDHESFLAEVRRVLRPGGVLIISTPDTAAYSANNTTPNPYHVRELTRDEFLSALSSVFRHVAMFGQRAFTGCAIFPQNQTADTANSGNQLSWIYEKRDVNAFEAHRQIPRPLYMVAFASDVDIAAQPGPSLYIQGKAGIAETPPDAIPGLLAQIAQHQAEITRLHNVEDGMNRQLQTLAKTVSEVVPLQAEAALRQTSLTRDLAEARSGRDLLDKQVEMQALVIRRQALTVQRLQLEIREQQGTGMRGYAAQIQVYQSQIGILNTEIEGLRTGYTQLTKLIIPIRLRNAVPGVIKNPLRFIKRALRNG